MKLSRLVCCHVGHDKYTSSVVPMNVESDSSSDAINERNSPNFLLKALLDYLSSSVEKLRSLDQTYLEQFDALTRECWSVNNYNFERILSSHGWNEESGWLQSMADFDSLLRAIGNYYLQNKTKQPTKSAQSDSNYLTTEEISHLSYCSDTLLMHLLAQPSRLVPSLSEVCGALLIVDMSGFSQFSAEMCSKGAAGLDSYFTVTNDFVCPFGNIVYEYDGDVIAFAGDTVICLFRKMNDKASFACLNAILCADKLNKHATLKARTNRKTNISMRFAIAYGEFKIASLGGLDNKWVPVLTGPCFVDLADCLKLAKIGEIVSTNTCCHHAFEASRETINTFSILKMSTPNRYLVESICSSPRDLPVDAVDPLYSDVPSTCIRKYIYSRAMLENDVVDMAKHFIPSPVVNAIQSDSLDHLSELRRVTTVHLRLDSFSKKMYQDPMQLQPFIKMVQQMIKESGGLLRHVLVNVTGCVVTAYWGLPMHASSNDASKALYFALSVVSEAKKMRLEVSGGIATGEALCANSGCDIRKVYVCLGDKVNLAYRLMSLANGRVLVDKETFNSVSRREKQYLVPAEEIQIKGAIRPIKPYTYASSEVPQLIRDSDMFGSHTILRAEVVRSLIQSLDVLQIAHKGLGRANKEKEYTYSELKSTMVIGRVEAGDRRKPTANGRSARETHTSFTVLMGSRGTGKSTAAQVFKEGAQKRGVTCIYIVGKPGDEGVVNWVYRKLLCEIMGASAYANKSARRKYAASIVKRIFPDKLSRQIHLMSSLEILFDFEKEHAVEEEDRSLSFQNNSSSSFDAYDRNSSLATGRNVPMRPNLSSSSVDAYDRKPPARKAGVSELKSDTDPAAFELFRAMLADKRLAIVIENAQYVDSWSWMELERLAASNLSLAFLLTLQSFPTSSDRHLRSKDFTKDKFSGNMMSSVRMGVPMDLPSEEKRSQSVAVSGHSDEDAVDQLEHLALLVDSETSAFQVKYGLRFKATDSYLSVMTSPFTTIIEMTGLTDDEMGTILQQTFGYDSVTKHLVDVVSHASSGNAFWFKVIIRYIQENSPDEFVRSVDTDHNFSRTVSSDYLKFLIVHRFDKLSAEAQQVAKHAAVIGDEFSLKMLSQVLPQRLQANLSKSLESLVEHGMIFFVEEEPVVVYSFHNELIRSTIYSTVPPSELRKMHEATAEFIENYFAADLKPYYVYLAYHYHRSSGKRSQAFKYAVKAADFAVSMRQFSRGFVYASRAKEMALGKAEITAIIDVLEIGIQDLSSRIPARQPKLFEKIGLSGLFSKPQRVMTAKSVQIHKLIDRYSKMSQDLKTRRDNNKAKSSMGLLGPSRSGKSAQLKAKGSVMSFSVEEDADGEGGHADSVSSAGPLSSHSMSAHSTSDHSERTSGISGRPGSLQWQSSYTKSRMTDASNQRKSRNSFCAIS